MVAFRDILSVVLIVVLGILLWLNKIPLDVFTSFIALVIGTYFGYATVKSIQAIPFKDFLAIVLVVIFTVLIQLGAIDVNVFTTLLGLIVGTYYGFSVGFVKKGVGKRG